jgi:hypothetical protein
VKNVGELDNLGISLRRALSNGIRTAYTADTKFELRTDRIQGIVDDLKSLPERHAANLEELATKANAKLSEAVSKGLKVPGGLASAESYLNRIAKGSEKLIEAKGIKTLITAVSDLNNIESAVVAAEKAKQAAAVVKVVDRAAKAAGAAETISETVTKEESMFGKKKAAEKVADTVEKTTAEAGEALKDTGAKVEEAGKAAADTAKGASEKAASFFRNAEGGLRTGRVAMATAAVALGGYALFGGKSAEKPSHAAKHSPQARQLNGNGQAAHI